ncbi:hypothetical protein [Smaragdicoccus niigatensis]|uniref:hypothetical protein n=1 Tax=Smaragdicoccus niigatensis TaxID=359359 RepID=UPI000382595E|nr:hypothetical protein [Smaragdicoccus niigatensis]
MAIAVVFDFDNATLEQYDQVIKLMELEPRGKAAPGSLFHWVTKTDNGIRVTDVWEDQDAFETFAAEQIGPFAAQAGFTDEPRLTFYDVHNFLTTP